MFGRGANPVNFVSAHDVARVVEQAVLDPALRGATLDVAGPDNLSLTQLARTVEAVTGRSGRIRRVPRPAMRLAAALLSGPKPALARQVRAGIAMDTLDMTAEAGPGPDTPSTTVADVVRRDYLPMRV